MRALTVQQPWAWAIVFGGKDVENRTQAWAYRGPLSIHAGSRWSERGAESPLVRAALDRIDEAMGIPADLRETAETLCVPERHSRGEIIGVVDLVDAHVCGRGCCTSEWAERDLVVETWRGPLGQTRSRFRVHLELANPRIVQHPIPAKGRLGLWTPDTDTMAQLREQVTW